jgi:hypothetical protein
MSAWLSFIGGYAKGANEQIDEQRKKEDQYIQDRMKMAAATRLEKQKEAEKQRQELKEADLSLSALPGYTAANTAQKIALLTSPVIRDQYVKRVSAGETVNLDEMISVDPKIAEQYKTVGDYMNTIQAKPKPVAPETTEAFKNPKRAFGARVGSGEEELRQNAARFGMSPEDALGWESGGQELPSMNVGATLKESAMKPTDIDGRLKLSEIALVKVSDMRKSADPAERAKAEQAYEEIVKESIQLRSMKQALEGTDPANMKRIRDDLVNRARLSKDPKEKKALEAELIEIERLENLGKRVPGDGTGEKQVKAPALVRAMSGNGAMKVRQGFGDMAGKADGFTLTETPSGEPIIGFNKNINPDLQRRIRQADLEGALEVARDHVDEQGRPKSMEVRLAMQTKGIDPDYFVKERQRQAVAPPVANTPRNAAPATKPAATAATGPIPVTMLEISQYANARNITPLQAQEEITKKKDVNGKPKYKVVQ